MHSKRKGSIGEMVVASELMRCGFFVFKELGDLSKVDLIALKDEKCLRIQIKSCHEKNGKICLHLKKSGPNYSFKYKKSDVDVFAVYILNKKEILYVPSTILDTNSNMVTLRFSSPKNNALSVVHWASDYRDIEKILRDFTWCTLPITEGSDKVQTTKE